jgi:Ca2+-transporting ATPase
VTGQELDRLPRGAPAGGRGGGRPLRADLPAHKLTIVSELRALGEVVAVTGTASTTHPRSRRPISGSPWGGAWSDVAKEAAVVVVTDDNFASIVGAIRQGRAVYANIHLRVERAGVGGARQVRDTHAAAPRRYGGPIRCRTVGTVVTSAGE